MTHHKHWQKELVTTIIKKRFYQFIRCDCLSEHTHYFDGQFFFRRLKG